MREAPEIEEVRDDLRRAYFDLKSVVYYHRVGKVCYTVIGRVWMQAL